jgi:RNA polymerase sigma factor (sigma-70 family)
MTQAEYLVLVKGSQKGERKSQELLYKALSSKMFAVCLRYAKDREEAEDMLQAGFIKVFTKLDVFNYSGSFEGWVRRIMVNTAIEVYRKNRFMSCTVDITESHNLAFHSVNEEGVEVKDLLRMISALPGTYRIIFNMFAIEGYSHQEIAAELNISENLSRTQLSRARTILKEKLRNLERKTNTYVYEAC